MRDKQLDNVQQSIPGDIAAEPLVNISYTGCIRLTYLAAHCIGVATRSPPTASTSAPWSSRYWQAGKWALIAAQCKGVMLSSSRLVALAFPELMN